MHTSPTPPLLKSPPHFHQFFTPIGSRNNSENWGEVDVDTRASPLLQEDDVSAAVSNCSWIGPAHGRRLGDGVIGIRPRGNIDDFPSMSASEGWAEGWHLRNVGYKKTGEKIPSLESLYTFVGVDLFRSKDPLANAGRHLKLPSVDFDCHGLPPCFVFNLQVPYCEAPSVWGQVPGGPTVNIIVAFVLKKTSADELEQIPQAKLVREMYKQTKETGSLGTDSRFLGRVKVCREETLLFFFSRFSFPS